MSPLALPFTKIEAAGNDFILIQGNLNMPPFSQLRDWPLSCRQLCRPHTGLGADGLLFAWEDGGWHWDFYNSDGSQASICGNAARAFTLWLSQGAPPNRSDFVWQGARHEIRGRQTKGHDPEVSWNNDSPFNELPSTFVAKVRKAARGQLEDLFCIDVGVPHLVVVSKSPWAPEMRAHLSPGLRSHATLGPNGANVTFLCTGTGELVTFERGVEAETLSCGSGALAAFRAWEKLEGDQGSRELKFPGGTLRVRHEQGALWLAGPARIVFEGRLLAKDLLV